MSPQESPVELQTNDAPTASIIWLHGLGADGHDFLPIVPEIGLPPEIGLRFVFPHAPYRPVTLNGGYVMRAWYDIVPAGPGFRGNPEHLREAQSTLEGLIEREIARGMPARRILLAGFSQGGAVALHTGLRSSRPLAGILALSAYLPGISDPEGTVVTAAPIPVFMAHGLQDPVIVLPWAERSRERLRQAGVPVDWHTYPMGHTLCPAELRDMAQWIRARLAVMQG